MPTLTPFARRVSFYTVKVNARDARRLGQFSWADSLEGGASQLLREMSVEDAARAVRALRASEAA